MESDSELSSEEDISFTKGYTPEERKRFEEEVRQWEEEWARGEMARVDKVINRNDGDEVINEKMEEDYNAEEMKSIAKEKMRRRRRERLMRHIRRRKKKSSKSQEDSDSESITTSDSGEEMKMAQEEVKRLMEKAIRETLTARDDTEIEPVSKKAEEEMNIIAAEKMMFPRRRGRLIRYLMRRQRSSKSQDSDDFQIEFHHLQLPEMSDSDD